MARSDKGVSRDSYDMSHRDAVKRHKEHSELVALMNRQLEEEDQVHIGSLTEAKRLIALANKASDDFVMYMKRAEKTINETARVRNQRERRRRQ